MKGRMVAILVSSLLSCAWIAVARAEQPGDRGRRLAPIEELGGEIFFDEDLSVNRNQSCATCHAPQVGWTGPDSAINATGAVYQGSVPGRFGNRKPPASAYAGASPVLHRQADGSWVGGMFWDGRATGERLGDPLAEQAQGPFLNPLEQGLPSGAEVVRRVCSSSYAHLFKQVWGARACQGDLELAYVRVARSIAAYERSQRVTAFTSRYDASLRRQARLTPEEQAGLALFNGKARCSRCHLSEVGADRSPPLFTDFTYDNLGIPRNPLNPFSYEYAWNPRGSGWIDRGLGGYLEAARPDVAFESQLGKFKVPTLRNVALREQGGSLVEGAPIKAYGHNGYFKSLEEIVHFYNTRDVLPVCLSGDPAEKVGCWPAPELAMNVNTTDVGDLGLSQAEEAALVAFLRTLSDGDSP